MSILDLIKIQDLNSESRGVNIKVKILELVSERMVRIKKNNKKQRVAEYKVRDETGTMILTVWGFVIDKIALGNSLLIENGYVSEFNGTLFLNIGKYGKWSILDDGEDENLVKRDDYPGFKFVKISRLKHKTTNINLEKVKVLDVNNLKHVRLEKDGKMHKVANAVLGDETGCIKCALWDEKIQNIKPNMILRIFGAYITKFRGMSQLNFSKNGRYEILPLKYLEVNIENNLSI